MLDITWKSNPLNDSTFKLLSGEAGVLPSYTLHEQTGWYQSTAWTTFISTSWRISCRECKNRHLVVIASAGGQISQILCINTYVQTAEKTLKASPQHFAGFCTLIGCDSWDRVIISHIIPAVTSLSEDFHTSPRMHAYTQAFGKPDWYVVMTNCRTCAMARNQLAESFQQG